MYKRQELLSATSHQYFGKRKSLGAQVAVFSYLALATRKHTTTIALVHTVFCPKTAPEAAAGRGRESSTAAAVAARTTVSSSSSSRSKLQRTAKASYSNIFVVVLSVNTAVDSTKVRPTANASSKHCLLDQRSPPTQRKQQVHRGRGASISIS